MTRATWLTAGILVVSLLVLACYCNKGNKQEEAPPEAPPTVPPSVIPPPPPFCEFVEHPIDVRDTWGVEAFALGDVDGDGLADLVLTTTWTYCYPDRSWYVGYSYYGIYDKPYSSTRVLLGDGVGAFSLLSGALPPPSKAKGLDIWHGDFVELGDLDGDGDLDLSLMCRDPAVSDNYTYSYTYTYDGTKYSYWYQYWYPTYGVLPQGRTLRGKGDGAFVPSKLSPCSVWREDQLKALGDIDGDGDLDKITHYDGVFRMWLWEEK